MMPWYAYVYLLLLAGLGAGGFVAALRLRRPLWLALAQLGGIAVLGYGVVLFFRGAGAGTGFALALFVATLLHAQKAVADAHTMRGQPLSPVMRVSAALGGLSLLPAIALGALAIWSRQYG